MALVFPQPYWPSFLPLELDPAYPAPHIMSVFLIMYGVGFPPVPPPPPAPQIYAGIFLVLYGAGLPLGLLAVVVAARKFRGEDGSSSGLFQSDEGQACSTERPLGFPLTPSPEAVDALAAVMTSSATVSGEEGEGEEEETGGMTEEPAWTDAAEYPGSTDRSRLRAGARSRSSTVDLAGNLGSADRTRSRSSTVDRPAYPGSGDRSRSRANTIDTAEGPRSADGSGSADRARMRAGTVDSSDGPGSADRTRMTASAEDIRFPAVEGGRAMEVGSRAKSASVSTIVTTTTVGTTSDREGWSSRAWKTSGRLVVGVRKAMSSTDDPWAVRTLFF